MLTFVKTTRIPHGNYILIQDKMKWRLLYSILVVWFTSSLLNNLLMNLEDLTRLVN